MSTFTTKFPESTIDDPYKRVRYTTGLVLGVDEFEQEQAYFIERDRLLTRALHGYGVVRGLRLYDEKSSEGVLELRVEPGLAIDPYGQHICVEREQCAIIDDWLDRKDAAELIDGASGTDEVCVSVVLRYGACATDFVPLPGEPCRSEEETRTASRLADDFSLGFEFEADRPLQVEEHVIRLLGRLMRALQVRPTEPYVSEDTLRRLVRALPSVLVSTDDAGEVFVEDTVSLADLAEEAEVAEASGVHLSETDDDPLLRVDPTRQAELLRAFEAAWVTHTRQEVLTTGHGEDPLDGKDSCHPVPRGEDGIVLGTLCIDVQSDGNGGVERVPDGDVTLSTERRPVLLATRVLQETSLFDRVHPGAGEGGGDGFEGAAADGDLTGTYPDPQVVGLDNKPLSMDPSGDPDLAAGQVLTYDGSTWRPEPLPEREPPPEPEPVPTNAETGLTRIVATSWGHEDVYAEVTALDLHLEEYNRDLAIGFAVAFGKEELALEGEEPLTAEGPGTVQARRLTEETFRVFFERNIPNYPLADRERLIPREVLPLAEVHLAGRHITGGVVGSPNGQARGAVFLFPPRETLLQILERAQPTERFRFEVEVRGDYILDEEGKAIDAEFVRMELPTGDRASGSEAGVQGGRFESWVYLGETSRVDLNAEDLTTERLMELPGVGEAYAARLLEYLDEHRPIDDPLDLVEVPGITDEMIRDEWRGRVDPPIR